MGGGIGRDGAGLKLGCSKLGLGGKANGVIGGARGERAAAVIMADAGGTMMPGGAKLIGCCEPGREMGVAGTVWRCIGTCLPLPGFLLLIGVPLMTGLLGDD